MADFPMNTRLRIAVADDEPEMRKFLHRVLTHEGHDVVVLAETGEQLIRECRDARPELIITDIEMPDLNGLDAIRQICTVASVPSIVVSANSTVDMVLRASRELVFAFLVKPIKMDDLRPAIWMTMHRFYEMSRLQHQLQTFL
jgi:response regulator NasT